MMQMQPFRAAPVTWKPTTYMKTCVEWLIKHPAAALFLDPGLRKTSITLAAFLLLKQAKIARKMLVIAPLRVCYQVWSKSGELGKWLEFKDLTVSLLHGGKKEEALQVDADIYAINRDALAWLVAEKRLDSLLKRGVDVLVLDELSSFKHTRTQRFRALKPYLPRFKRRWGLTGSPAANGLMDLFGECYALDLGKALGKFVTHYRFQYFYPTGFQGKEWVLQPGAEKRIYDAIRPLALSMKATDHLVDLPQLVEQNIWVELPPEARKIYDSLKENFIAAIKDGTITAVNAAVLSGKLRQVASGGVYLHPEWTMSFEDTKVTQIHMAKSEALKELVDELQGEHLFVGYEFHHDYERMQAGGLPGVPTINGDTNPKESELLCQRWNFGELPILTAHPAAVGHGLNLQGSHCAHVCWYTCPWNYELYDQFNRRVYRSGNQAKRVIVHRILARDTIDEVVVSCLRQKGRTQKMLFEALKEHFGC